MTFCLSGNKPLQNLATMALKSPAGLELQLFFSTNENGAGTLGTLPSELGEKTQREDSLFSPRYSVDTDLIIQYDMILGEVTPAP